MKLYHFTGKQHLAGIRQAGLRIGGIPDPRGLKMGRFSWLTDNPVWSQPWAPRPVHCNDGHICDRTAMRLTVVIPKTSRACLIPWFALGRGLGLSEEWMIELDRQGGGDSLHWYIFNGVIPFGWVRDVAFRPSYVLVPV